MDPGRSSVERLGGDPPSPFEDRYGFSRVVAAGEFVLLGGTTSVDTYGFVQGDTPYEQMAEILRKAVRELERCGAGIPDVIMGRVYVTDISRSEEVGRAWSEVFGSVRPLMTMVEVSGLIDPRMLVEVELVARRGAGG